jgi:hypothetical protein|tara:strand:+ start:1322 stop:1810 length:489 start_codon:yes stop_codon:yes gene_type:complete
MAKKESSLEKLKKDYDKIQKKYNLPDFKKLNEDFNIEKISETETEYLIREVRRFMGEKFTNYLRFSEIILNPINAPMFILSVIKSIKSEDRKKLTETYKKLSKIEVQSIELEIEFSDTKEADFIKESFKTWQEIKKDLLELTETIKISWDDKFESNNKSYFG